MPTDPKSADESPARQNSYAKSEPRASDVQKGGPAGDLGNGPETGHKVADSATAPASQDNVASPAEQQKQRAKHASGSDDARHPEEAGEAPNSYSGS